MIPPLLILARFIRGRNNWFERRARPAEASVSRRFTAAFFVILGLTVELREWAEAHFFIGGGLN